mgnify:CR=1 FL=1
MVGRVLGESWGIYKNRFGIILLFSFLFFALGTSLYYGGILAVSQQVAGFSIDYINMAVRLVQGTPFEDVFLPNYSSFGGTGLAAMPLMIIGMMGAGGLMLAYSILAVPMGMGGLTVLSSGAGGPLSFRSVFRGVRKRYGKLLVTYLCYMVYGMAAGFAFMIVYMILGVLIAIAVALIGAGSGAGIAFGVVLITLAVLLVIAAYTVMLMLAVFIMPAAVFDRLYNFKAVGRSIKMAWGHFFSVLGVQLVTLLLLGIMSLLLFGVFFAIAWAGPDIPIYTPLWLACTYSLVWPFYIIVNGVLYRHIQDKDAAAEPAA